MPLDQDYQDNLRRLADFLDGPDFPAHFQFDMGCFLRAAEGRADLALINYEAYEEHVEKHTEEDAEERDPRFHACGSVGCVIGCMPFIVPELAAETSNYLKLCEKFTGISASGYCPKTYHWITRDSWEYLFAAAWEHVDNTREGAAARIRRYLELGCRVPPYSEWWDPSNRPVA